MRYFIQMSYNGTRYHGWQIQPSAITIQEEMEKSLQTLLRDPAIKVTGQGRTDTGVHASFFVAHFDTKVEIADLDKVAFRLNRFISPDIAIQNIYPVPDDAHARFSATFRKYTYYISTTKNPFEQETTAPFFRPLDVEQMSKACDCLFNHIDFTSFSKLHTDVKTNNCKIMEAYFEQKGDVLKFSIKADRFLRNMVRAIMGTLLDVGHGKLTVEQFNQIIIDKNRGRAGSSVPASGLFLVDIGYPEEYSTGLKRP